MHRALRMPLGGGRRFAGSVGHATDWDTLSRALAVTSVSVIVESFGQRSDLDQTNATVSFREACVNWNPKLGTLRPSRPQSPLAGPCLHSIITEGGGDKVHGSGGGDTLFAAPFHC